MNSSLSPTEQLSSPFGIIWQVIVLNKESPFELSIAEMVILTSNKEVEIIIFPTLPTALVSLSRITITFLGYLFIFALVTHLTALSDNLRLWFLLSSYYFMTQLNLHAIGPVLVTIAEQQAWNWGISTLIYSLITPLQTFCNRCTSVLLRK